MVGKIKLAIRKRRWVRWLDIRCSLWCRRRCLSDLASEAIHRVPFGCRPIYTIQIDYRILCPARQLFFICPQRSESDLWKLNSVLSVRYKILLTSIHIVLYPIYIVVNVAIFGGLIRTRLSDAAALFVSPDWRAFRH